MSNDGILDALGIEMFGKDDARRSLFKKAFRIAVIPIFFIFLFFMYYFVFIRADWTIMSVTARIIILVFIIIFILLLSEESIEWRLISISVVVFIIVVDVAAQLLDFYETPTEPGGTLQYDFLGHIFTGILTIAFLTNAIPRAATKRIFLVIALSLGIALGWELTEYAIALTGENIMGREIEAFVFDWNNALMDVIAHGIGIAIAVSVFFAYKYLRCPTEQRSGLVCKI